MEESIRLLLNMSFAASFVILIVVLVRRLFVYMGVPKKYAYLLWLLPFIRMVCPWSLESNMSLLPDMTRIVEYASQEDLVSGVTSDMGDGVSGTVPDLRNEVSDTPSNGKSPESDTKQYGNKDDLSNQGYIWDNVTSDVQKEGIPSEDVLNKTKDRNNNIWLWVLGIWMAGIAGIVCYSAVNYVKLKKRLDASIHVRDNIYLHDDIETGFVAGCIRPCIYLPSGLSERDMEYIISHEQVHIARRDYQIKMLAFAATAMHWFNPICWLAFVLLGKDIEMSCDEAVIDKMGAEDKKAYANVLLYMAAGKRRFADIQLMFAQGNSRERIENIMKSKKPMLIVSVLALLVIGVLAWTLLTNPGTKAEQPGTTGEETAQGTEAYNSSTEANKTSAEDSGAKFDNKRFNVKPASLETVNPDDLPYGEVQITEPMVTDWGADSVNLIHATPEYAVGWGYMGLFVYSVQEKKLTGAVDVRAIGCDATQGNSYTDVFVGDSDRVVYMHPIDKEYMFVYDIHENTLEKQKFVDGGNKRPKGVKVNDNRQETEDVLNGQVPDGWMSTQCEAYMLEPNQEKRLGYLASGSGEISDLSYVIIEWNQAERAWGDSGDGIWSPYMEERYPFFEGESESLVWRHTDFENRTDENEGFFLKAGDISAKGLTLGLYNKSNADAIYGEEYHLYSRTDFSDEWKELPYLQESAFHEPQYTLEEGEMVNLSIDWTWLYGKLTDIDWTQLYGESTSEIKVEEYKLVKKIFVPKSEGDKGESSKYKEEELVIRFTLPQ